MYKINIFCRGLQYLHTFKEKPLIHGDIKPANILLDSSCIPKIGDFGKILRYYYLLYEEY